MQSSIRTGKFPEEIKYEILNMIQKILFERNPYVKNYMHASE